MAQQFFSEIYELLVRSLSIFVGAHQLRSYGHLRSKKGKGMERIISREFVEN